MNWSTLKGETVPDSASPGSMHDTGCLGLVHWDDPEGWYGEGGGRRVRWGLRSSHCRAEETSPRRVSGPASYGSRSKLSDVSRCFYYEF